MYACFVVLFISVVIASRDGLDEVLSSDGPVPHPFEGSSFKQSTPQQIVEDVGSDDSFCRQGDQNANQRCAAALAAFKQLDKNLRKNCPGASDAACRDGRCTVKTSSGLGKVSSSMASRVNFAHCPKPLLFKLALESTNKGLSRSSSSSSD